MQEQIQIVSVIVIFIPIIYWAKMKLSRTEKMVFDEGDRATEISILLPMRNEKKNVIRKLKSMIEEIADLENTKLYVFDSCSNDGTGDLAHEFLKLSKIPKSRWKVISLETPGKSFAINRALEIIKSDVVIMSDADALVSPGWMNNVTEALSDEDIGVVSGIEYEANRNSEDFNTYYRRNSNFLRVMESKLGSTTVLEGSLIAWKTSALGDFQLNENMNADDAQIGLRSIRRGYRSVIDERIRFRGFDEESRSFSESVRRSQGLSKALILNADLIFRAKRKGARGVVLNSLVLYVLFPWSIALFAVNSITAFFQDSAISLDWPFVSVSLITIILISGHGRMLSKGVIISIIAHCQIVLGKSYKSWNPRR